MAIGYEMGDLYACLARGHHFQIFGSDKTPLKRSLLCSTCTKAAGQTTVLVASGVDVGSWGQWRKRRLEEAVEVTEASE